MLENVSIEIKISRIIYLAAWKFLFLSKSIWMKKLEDYEIYSHKNLFIISSL